MRGVSDGMLGTIGVHEAAFGVLGGVLMTIYGILCVLGICTLFGVFQVTCCDGILGTIGVPEVTFGVLVVSL